MADTVATRFYQMSEDLDAANKDNLVDKSRRKTRKLAQPENQVFRKKNALLLVNL